jgi:hypothetical protein
MKAAAACVLAVTAVVVSVSRMRRGLAVGEERLQVWFYDQSEHKLYAASREAIPPHRGIGGGAGDGVRAVVVACRGEQDDPHKRRIAYLETYTPELKKLLEDIRDARAHGRKYEGPVPDRESEFFQKNTLVRLPDEATWHDMTTNEGQQIVTQWQSWSCPDGNSRIVCSP